MKKQDFLIFHKKKTRLRDTGGLKYSNELALFEKGIFTTFRTYQGKIPFLGPHLERLERGITFFYPKKEFKTLKLHMLIGLRELTSRSEVDLRYRITIFEKENAELDFIISTFLIPKPQTSYQITKGLRAKGPVPMDIKWGNYAKVLKEVDLVKERGFDDIVFFSEDEKLLECSTSNIFLIKEKVIYTPKVNECFLRGIILKNLIKYIDVEEKDLYLKDLRESEEVFLTNSVRGIISVSRFENIDFKNVISDKIIGVYKKMIEENCE